MNDSGFMKTKPVIPLVFSMSVPMVVSMLVNSLYNIVDSFYVAAINEEAMTALSLVFPIQNLIQSTAVGFGVGINATIAYFLGAGDNDKANKAASTGLVLAFIHSILLTFFSIAVMPHFLSMFTDSDVIISYGIRYSVIAFAFSPINVIGITFEKIFQAVGRMKVSMLALMSGCITNIILDPIMIFGLGPFPEMGIDGAALATGIGQLVALVIYLLVALKRPLCVKIKRSFVAWNGWLVKKLYAIGIPATLNMALPSILISALNAILAVYSSVYVLILGIYYKLQTFLYLPASGFVQGMRPIIGYNYGAGEEVRVKRIFFTVLVMCVLIMFLGTLLSIIFPSELIGLFTDNQETITKGSLALRIISGGFIISSVSVAASGALEGLGKGFPSLVISLLRYIVIIIPLAYFLSQIPSLGAEGVWHAFWLSEVVTAVFSFMILRSIFRKRV